jgi:hypothetical protein
MPPTPRANANRAQRKIYFCKAQHLTNPQASPALDSVALIQALNQLPGTADFYLEEGDQAGDQQLCAVVDKQTAPQRVRFYRVRRSDLPETEAAGQFRALQLGAQDGLAESIHMVFFDDDVVGAEYNHWGPRATIFGRFIRERCSQQIRLRYLIQANVIEQILNLPEIRKLRIKVEPSAAAALGAEGSGLGELLDVGEFFERGRYVDLTLAANPEDQAFTDRVKGVLRWLRQRDAIEQIDAFDVYGKTEDEELQSLSLFSDRVIVQKEIARESPRSRALDKDSAYAAVESAYRELQAEIRRGSTITVDV